MLLWAGADGGFMGPEVSTAWWIPNWGILKLQLQGQYTSAPCKKRNGKCQIALDLLLCSEHVGLPSRSHQSKATPRLRIRSQQPPESLLVTDGNDEGSSLTSRGNGHRSSGGNCQSPDQLCIPVWFGVFYLCGLKSASLSFLEVLWASPPNFVFFTVFSLLLISSLIVLW